ncbi:hypothetical protein M2139_000950 [Enterococcus sp. PF1-24]|uniref:hypothetical protein n=1 Tax=unclassified Enterococcus TaxID=2608891 RepID=UPI0024771F51|nr:MULTISPECIES: hypothetical protein [unclassified Enterococcus]MDH6363965.1 hypothetical protein [Enterococcus sp. PFB1-1]MDH6401066.1 hypothetical protein [Enterococcus sp. PF1-24]
MRGRLFILILLVFLPFSACKQTESKENDNFSKETIGNLKTNAKEYSEDELQNGEVPLNEYVRLTGEIVESDSSDEIISKGDRFILKSGDSQYQIFNQQDIPLQIADELTVYGEYYGFIKADLIEKE